MFRTCWAVGVAGLVVLCSGAADPAKCTLKVATTEPPKELAEPIRALLSTQTVQVLEADKLVCELWFAKELPAKAGTDLQKGLTYRQLEESTIFGAVRFVQPWISYRKQNIKPGVFTLRLGIQPMDGDHMGTAPYNEFLLLCPASEDKKAATMPHKQLAELSGKTIPGSTHPAIMLLFPNPKPEDKPQLVGKPNKTWVLNWKKDVSASGKKAVLGVGLTLFGVTEAE